MRKTPGSEKPIVPDTVRAQVEDRFRYEIEVHSRKANWTAEQNSLIGRAWIGRFWSEPGYHFQQRDIFFLIERDGARVSGGTLTVWRAQYDEQGGGWDLDELVAFADLISLADYTTALAVARIWGTDDERNWWTDRPFSYGDLCRFDQLVIDANTFRWGRISLADH